MGNVKKHNLVKIDRNKLIEELKKRGLDMTKASVDIGYNPNYLAAMTNAGKREASGREEGISQRAVKLLFELYNIRLESIMPDPQPEPEAVEPQPGDTFTLNENTLYRIMYAAIVHGIRDCAGDIEKAVYNAVKVAWGE